MSTRTSAAMIAGTVAALALVGAESLLAPAEATPKRTRAALLGVGALPTASAAPAVKTPRTRKPKNEESKNEVSPAAAEVLPQAAPVKRVRVRKVAEALVIPVEAAPEPVAVALSPRLRPRLPLRGGRRRRF